MLYMTKRKTGKQQKRQLEMDIKTKPVNTEIVWQLFGSDSQNLNYYNSKETNICWNLYIWIK